MATVSEVNKCYNDAKDLYDKLYSTYFNKPGCGQSYSFPKKIGSTGPNADCCKQFSSCPPSVDKYNALIICYEVGKETQQYKDELLQQNQSNAKTATGKLSLYIGITVAIILAAIGGFMYFKKKGKI